MTDSSNMELSRHNILAPLARSDTWVIVNPLSQNADLLTRQEAFAIRSGTFEDRARLVERGYLVEPAEEKKRYRAAYLNFISERDDDEVQLFYAPSYVCNFDCDYCYQESYAAQPEQGTEVVDAFVRYIDENFANRRKYVTLFGGEPLLPSASRRRDIERLVDALVERQIDMAVVTNGYHLEEYLPLLRRANLREVQVTLDGVGPLHNRRRPLRGGGNTFNNIVAGVDACVVAGVPVNLRMVVDRENLDGLVDLAHFAKGRGWLEQRGFKTQLGRNYELHSCAASPDRLFDRLEMHLALHDLAKKYPVVLEFHRPAFSVARFLADHGALPAPLFDACPGTKTEWAFDGTGHIYACTATVGKTGEHLGSFYPRVTLDEDAVSSWEDRDVLAIEACNACSSQLICGAGCAAVAKNRTGDLHGTDCRPVPELLGLGANLYLRSET